MPEKLINQQEGQEELVTALSADYFLVVLVLVVLSVFYVVIMYILKSADNDRTERLNKLK
jgi:Na+-driven multidrug efflux pump